MPITEIAQGNHDHQWQLTDLNNSDNVVGSVKVTADYKWLRDTKDEGSYEHASQVVINKRRMRQFLVSHGRQQSKMQGELPVSCLTTVQVALRHLQAMHAPVAGKSRWQCCCGLLPCSGGAKLTATFTCAISSCCACARPRGGHPSAELLPGHGKPLHWSINLCAPCHSLGSGNPLGAACRPVYAAHPPTYWRSPGSHNCSGPK